MDKNTARYYQVLNVEPGCSEQQITQAYQDLIRVWDPSRFANSPRLEVMAEQKLSEIIEAYHALVPAAAAPVAPPAPPESPIADHNVPPPLDEPLPMPRLVSVFEPRAGEVPNAAKPAGQTQGPQTELAAAPPPSLLPEEPDILIGELERPEPKRRPPGLLMIAACAVGVAAIVAGCVFVFEARHSRPASRPAAHAPAAAAPAPEVAPPEEETASSHPARSARSARSKPEAPPPELATGTDLIAPRGRTGAGRFSIRNESGKDAVVKVADRLAPATPLRLVYVRAATETAIAGLGPGMYVVSFSLGPLTKKPRAFGAPAGPFEFVQVQGVGGYQSDEYRLVIKPGN